MALREKERETDKYRQRGKEKEGGKGRQDGLYKCIRLLRLALNRLSFHSKNHFHYCQLILC